MRIPAGTNLLIVVCSVGSHVPWPILTYPNFLTSNSNTAKIVELVLIHDLCLCLSSLSTKEHDDNDNEKVDETSDRNAAEHENENEFTADRLLEMWGLACKAAHIQDPSNLMGIVIPSIQHTTVDSQNYFKNYQNKQASYVLLKLSKRKRTDNQTSLVADTARAEYVSTESIVKISALSGYVTHPLGYAESKNVCALAMEWYPPYKSSTGMDLYTLENVLQNLGLISEVEWKATLFQVLFSLTVLQRKISGFMHNDLKPSNIVTTHSNSDSNHQGQRLVLLESGSCDPAYCWMIPADAPRCVMIDFEVAHSRTTSVQSPLVDLGRIPQEYAEAFALSSEFCPFSDAFLVLGCAYKQTSRQRPRWARNFHSFVERVFPVECMLKGRRASELVTATGRLTAKGRREMLIAWGNKQALTPCQCLFDPYFDELRIK